MKRFYWAAGVVLIAVVLIMLLVPGVSAVIEGQVLALLARLAG